MGRESRADLAPIFASMRAGLDEAGRKALDEALIAGNLTADHPIFYVLIQMQAQQKAINDLIKIRSTADREPDQVAIKTQKMVYTLGETANSIFKVVEDLKYDVERVIDRDVRNLAKSGQSTTLETIHQLLAEVATVVLAADKRLRKMEHSQENERKSQHEKLGWFDRFADDLSERWIPYIAFSVLGFLFCALLKL